MSAKENSTRPLAIIFGVEGTSLSAEEKDFIKEANPLGFLLFARNIESPDQVKGLVSDMRSLTGRDDTPILIDQEGGRVARLRKPHWPELPPLKAIGDRPIEKAKELTVLHAGIIATMLNDLGIDVVCAPVLDVPVPGSHDVIGDRAFSQDPETVAILGGIYAQVLIEHGVTPIIKHIPGHGRAMCDSHFECPYVDVPFDDLAETDFLPFQKVSARTRQGAWGMTAHVVMNQIDPHHPATSSPDVIRTVIRDHIGFDGFLVGDDLSMAALKGTLTERTKNSLAAGCDALLHCNGNMIEMKEIAGAAETMSAQAWKRFSESVTKRHISKKIDTSPLHERVNALYDSLTEADLAKVSGHAFLGQ